MVAVPGDGGRGKGLRWLATGVAAVALVGGGYWLMAPGAAPTVLTSVVAQGEVVGRVVASGVVEASRKEDVTSRVAGVLEAFDLREGRQVQQGQVIARIARTPLEAALTDAQGRLLAQQSQLAQLERHAGLADTLAATRLEAAEQKLQLARSQLSDQELAVQRGVEEAAFGVTRAQLQLAKQPSSDQLTAEVGHATELMRNAQADLDRLGAADHPARLQVALAEADLKAAQVDIAATAVLPQELEAARGAAAAAARAVQKAQEDLDNANIRAPFTGVVVQVYAKQGAGVAPGTPLIALAALDTARIVANVDEADVGRMASGQKATVTSPAIPEMKFQGEVTVVRPRAVKDTSNATVVPAEVEFRNEGGRMREGMNADVEIDVERRPDALRIPLTALRGKGSDRYVFVEEGGLARKRAVTPGVRDPRWAEVLDGLKAGDRVVTGPESVLKGLEDGQAVRARGQE
jgi:RND family efflux transporter MFP subunit